MDSSHPPVTDTLSFLRLLDTDPHERLPELESAVAGLPPEEQLDKGLNALKADDSLLALVCFEQASKSIHTPELKSHLAFCIAKEHVQFDRAVNLCNEAIAEDPDDTRHYLNLGRIYLMQGKKQEAIATFHEGLRHGPSPEIVADLQLIGIRRRPIVPFLKRDNVINRSLGYLVAMAKKRKCRSS